MSAAAISPKEFENKTEEISFWKNLAQEYKEKMDSARNEWRQLEQEYQSKLDRDENKNKELSIKDERLHNEIVALKVMKNICLKSAENQITKIKLLENEKRGLEEKLEELQERNADLERFRKMTEESGAMEECAILKKKTKERNYLKQKLQRWADKVEDLSEELHLRQSLFAKRMRHFCLGLILGFACFGIYNYYIRI